MENAADALKMAGAVLLFVLALSIIILSFGQVRQSADTIIDYKDRETFYIDSNFYYDVSVGKQRKVNLETIIPSVFRAYLENYKIVFDGLKNPLYKINGNIEKRSLDLETNKNTEYENVVLANNEQKREFLCGILYGKYENNEKEKFEKKFNIDLSECKYLYEQLKDKNDITEYLGVYYQNDSPNEPNVNKTEKRIITYKIIND